MRTLKINRRPKGFDNEFIHTGYHDGLKKVIAVDFDGTLVFNHYPFIENPNVALINFINAHRQEYTWILWTCRHDEQLKYAVDYLQSEFGLIFDFINENVPQQIEMYGDCRKVWADIYIDDKNCLVEEFEKCIKET